ncbi:hypothetical protein Tco_1158793 [Tanacetum coccineum]
MDDASDLGANGLKEGSSSQPTIAKASIVDNFVSIKNSMDSNNSCEANEANKQTPYEWTEDFESDDEVDEVLYHKEISLKINLISSLKVEFGIFCMYTWNSERTSPLAFDAEIEKAARQNCVLHQATLSSSSVRIDLEGAPLDNFESENFEKSFESDVEVEEVEIVNMAKGIDTYFRSGSFEDPSPVVYRTSELFHESLERLNDLLRSCPHHDIPKWELVKIFYGSLDASNRQFLLAASAGLFFTRPSNFHVQNMNQGRQGELSLEQKIEQIMRSQADMMELLRKNEQKAEINSKSMGEIGIQVGQLADERSTRPTPIPTEGVVEDYVSDEEEDPMTVEMNDKIILKETKESFQNDFKAPKQLKLGKGVNIPLIDAIKQIPAYAKFLKDMYTLKRCHKKVDSIAHVSIALINSLLLKYKDPGAPLISIEIVEEFYYPLDFQVLDTEYPCMNIQTNVILGRPFLATIEA